MKFKVVGFKTVLDPYYRWMPRVAPLPGRDGGARQAHREKLVNLIDTYQGDVSATPWPAQLADLDAGKAIVVGSWQVLPEFRPPGIGMTSVLRIEPDGRVIEVEGSGR